MALLVLSPFPVKPTSQALETDTPSVGQPILTHTDTPKEFSSFELKSETFSQKKYDKKEKRKMPFCVLPSRHACFKRGD